MTTFLAERLVRAFGSKYEFELRWGRTVTQIRVTRPIKGRLRRPYAVDFYSPEPTVTPYPRIKVVCGPGVEVRMMQGTATAFLPVKLAPAPDVPSIELTRVQNPDAVPGSNTAIDVTRYEGDSLALEWHGKRSYIGVRRRHDGVDLIYRRNPSNEGDGKPSYAHLNVTVDPWRHDQRYAYRVVAGAQPRVDVVCTSNVTWTIKADEAFDQTLGKVRLLNVFTTDFDKIPFRKWPKVERFNRETFSAFLLAEGEDRIAMGRKEWLGATEVISKSGTARFVELRRRYDGADVTLRDGGLSVIIQIRHDPNDTTQLWAVSASHSVRIYRTDGIKVYVDADRFGIRLMDLPGATTLNVFALPLSDFPDTWTVDHGAAPIPGARSVPVNGYLGATPDNITWLRQNYAELGKMSADIAIGFIPVVGDLVDLGDLLYGVVTGKDRYGRPVSTFDLCILAAAVLLPVVSAKTMGLITEIGKNADDVMETATDISRALSELPENEINELRRLETKVKNGDALDGYERSFFQRLMSWVQGWLEAEMAVASSHRRIADLLDESGTGFADVVIADHYDNYRAALSGDPFPPEKWLRNLPTAHPARKQIRSYLGEIAHDIEFAATAEEYIVALRRDLSGGHSGGGRHWDWERFDPQKPGPTPEVDFGHRSEFYWRPGDPVNAPTSRGLKPLYEGGDAAGKPRYWNNLVYFEVRKAAADPSYEIPEFLREGYQGMHLVDESADGVLTAKPDPFRQMIETAKTDPDALPELVLENIGGKPPKYEYAIDLPNGTRALESKSMEIEHLIPQRAANDWADVMAASTGEQLAATRQSMGLGPDAAVDFKREASSLFHQADSDYFYPVTREEHGSLDAFAKVKRSNRVDPGGDIPDGVTVRLGDSAEDTMTAAPSLKSGGLGRSGRDARVDRPMMYVPEKDLRQAARLLPAGMPPGLPVRLNDAGHVVSNAYEATVQRIAVEIEARGLRGPEFELHPAFQHLYSEF